MIIKFATVITPLEWQSVTSATSDQLGIYVSICICVLRVGCLIVQVPA